MDEQQHRSLGGEVARIHDLMRQLVATDADLAADLQREIDALSERRAFGLNFERHTPEQVELPGRPVRRGDKVHVLPPRGETTKQENKIIWVVESIDRSEAEPVATLLLMSDGEQSQKVAVADLVVVSEFRDPIYPGLVSTGSVERGGDKPFHTVINGENFHALEALLFTHRGKVDAIYIDPPYNTGARDWKYNNDYVESEDLYRHSKWLAFMERRLKLAKELLNPEDSVLIVTIDEKEYLRLGLLLEQTFPETYVQMISSVVNQTGSSRQFAFSRSDEYIYVLFVGAAAVKPTVDDMLHPAQHTRSARWSGLLRGGGAGKRSARPNLFYPIFFSDENGSFHSVGEALPAKVSRHEVPNPPGTFAVYPIGSNGEEMRWGLSPNTLREHISKGYVKFGPWNRADRKRSISHIQSGTISAVEEGSLEILGVDPEGTLVLADYEKPVRPMTTWNKPSHSAGDHGSSLLRKLLPNRNFPFPKSLFAVEDALRFFISAKPDATVIDFFSGSGTTTHAVMRLNKQDGGRRQSISVTNNEVSADEQKDLVNKGLRPGDAEWERWGICDHITKPRIRAAVTGKTPDGEPIKGDYKFTDEFPMADGFEENVEFFTLTYEAPLQVASGRAFGRIAPLMWMRAGSTGPRINTVPDAGWGVAETYGVLVDLDRSDTFVNAIAERDTVTHAFLFTDEDRLFESISQQLPEHVEVVRMYDAYLRNAEVEAPAVNR